MSAMKAVYYICSEITAQWDASQFAAVGAAGIPSQLGMEIDSQACAAGFDPLDVRDIFIDYCAETAAAAA